MKSKLQAALLLLALVFCSFFTGCTGTASTNGEPNNTNVPPSCAPDLTMDFEPLTCEATTGHCYYVAQENPACNDSGPGSFDVPFCTIAAANNAHEGGDYVYILKGEYRENPTPKSGLGPTQRTVYSGYGNREDIKILGSDEVTGWSVHSGSVYEASFTAPSRCGGISTSCIEDRAKWYLPVFSLGEVDQPGEYYYDGSTLYLYAWTDTPSDHKIECSVRAIGLDEYSEGGVNVHYFVFQNMSVMHSHDRGITTEGNDNVIHHNIFEFNSGCQSSGANPASIYKGKSDAPLPMTITNNVIRHQGSDLGPWDYSGGGDHSGAGITLYDVDGACIANNEIYDAVDGVYIKSGSNNPVNFRNLTITGNIIHDIWMGVDIGRGDMDVGTTPYVGIVEKNLIYNASGGGIGIKLADTNLDIIGNSLLNTAGIPIGWSEACYQNTIIARIKNNIIDGLYNPGNVFIGYFYESSAISDSDYNLFYGQEERFGLTDVDCPDNWICDNYSPNTASVYYNTFDDWKNTTGHDIHSKMSDPLFVSTDPASADFLKLSSDSPAKNAGEKIDGYHCAESDDVNPGQTGCRHWSGSAPDIGAIEYTDD